MIFYITKFKSLKVNKNYPVITLALFKEYSTNILPSKTRLLPTYLKFTKKCINSLQIRYTSSSSKVVKEAAKALDKANVPPINPGVTSISPQSVTTSVQPTHLGKSESSSLSYISNRPNSPEKPGILKTHEEGQKVLNNISKATTEINKFTLLEQQGVIEYGKNGETKLTKEAYELYRQMQPKVKLLPDETNSLFKLAIGEEAYVSTPDVPLIAGSLTVHEDTEILSPPQSHLVVGSDDPNLDTIGVFSYLTSDKGMQAGIAGFSPSTTLSDTQPISGKSIPQMSSSMYPLVNVNRGDFTEHSDATEYVNQPDIKEKFQDIKEKVDRYEPVNYNSTGITISTLEELSDLKASLNQQTISTQTINTEAEDTDSITLHTNEEVD